MAEMVVRELSSSPSPAVVYPKAAAGLALSALRRLPLVPSASRELPDVELVLADVGVDRGELAAYDRVCTFEIADELPLTYPHVLAFPLAMEVMTDLEFPFPVVGLVHVRNRIERLRPIGAEERLDLRVRAVSLAEHARGTQFDLVAVAEVGGEVVWRSTSTYLHLERSGASGERARRHGPERPELSFAWSVPADVGRRYAAASGDRNPIHLHPLTARLFGQARPIAHGMWLKARCLAVLGDAVPAAATVEVEFKLPVVLPGRVGLSVWEEGGRCRLALHDAATGRPHLTGSVSPLRRERPPSHAGPASPGRSSRGRPSAAGPPRG